MQRACGLPKRAAAAERVATLQCLSDNVDVGRSAGLQVGRQPHRVIAQRLIRAHLHTMTSATNRLVERDIAASVISSKQAPERQYKSNSGLACL